MISRNPIIGRTNLTPAIPTLEEVLWLSILLLLHSDNIALTGHWLLHRRYEYLLDLLAIATYRGVDIS
jgi:hypothetical protein